MLRRGSMSIRFSMKKVSEYCGLSPHVLRAWERRYGVLVPARTAKGQRTYTSEQAEYLRLLSWLNAQGHVISSLVQASVDELRTLERKLLEEKAQNDDQGAKNEALVRSNISKLQKRVTRFQSLELLEDLRALREALSARDVLLQVIYPMLVYLGDRVAKENISIAEEHAVSAVLKVFLGELFFTMQYANKSRHNRNSSAKARDKKHLLFATVEGDFHEFGILIAGCLAGVYGIRATMLGCNMPALALAEACRALKPDIVIISRTRSVSTASFDDKIYFEQLHKNLLKSVDVWLAGQAATAFSDMRRDRPTMYFPSLYEFEEQLRRIVGL